MRSVCSENLDRIPPRNGLLNSTMTPFFRSISIISFLALQGVLGVSPSWADADLQKSFQLFREANAALDRKEIGTAETLLDQALDLEPNFSEAYYLKGIIEYKTGQTTRGQEFIERAQQLNPMLSVEIRQALQKRAMAIENNLTTEDFEHFRLEFHGAERREEAWTAVQYLNEAYNDLGSALGQYPSGRIPVIILTSSQFQNVWRAPTWEAGFFSSLDGRIRIRLESPSGTEDDYRRRLRHELTHAYLHGIYGGTLPRWFNEGVAEFYAYSSSSDMQWKDVLLEKIERKLRHIQWLTIAQMYEVNRNNRAVSAGWVQLAYLEGQALVLYTAKERGDSFIPSIITRLPPASSSELDSQAFDAAFEEVVGLTPDAMLKQLYESVQ